MVSKPHLKCSVTYALIPFIFIIWYITTYASNIYNIFFFYLSIGSTTFTEKITKEIKHTRGIKTRTADAIEQGISIHVSSHNKNDKMGWVGVG